MAESIEGFDQAGLIDARWAARVIGDLLNDVGVIQDAQDSWGGDPRVREVTLDAMHRCRRVQDLPEDVDAWDALMDDAAPRAREAVEVLRSTESGGDSAALVEAVLDFAEVSFG